MYVMYYTHTLKFFINSPRVRESRRVTDTVSRGMAVDKRAPSLFSLECLTSSGCTSRSVLAGASAPDVPRSAIRGIHARTAWSKCALATWRIKPPAYNWLHTEQACFDPSKGHHYKLLFYSFWSLVLISRESEIFFLILTYYGLFKFQDGIWPIK